MHRAILFWPCLLCVVGQTIARAAAPDVFLARPPENGIQPQAVSDERGAVHLIYFKGEAAAGDLFYVRQEAGRTNFTKPLRVNSNPGSAMAVGSIRGGQIAVGKNGRVHVVWNGMGSGAQPVLAGGKKEAPLLYSRLNDPRERFEPERNVIQQAFGLDGGSSLAADRDGNVHVFWHTSKPGNTNGEAGRALFYVRSTDEGKTFSAETLATTTPTGACGCCGMRAFADSLGNLYALYRGASNMVHRGEILLFAKKGSPDFQIAYLHNWQVASCPMSSAFLSEGAGGVLAAAETHGRVFFVKVDPKTGKASAPISPEAKAKHPVCVANARGETLLAWTEGTGWAKGGSVAWQIFNPEGQALTQPQRAPGVPPWGLLSAVALPDGNFRLFY